MKCFKIQNPNSPPLFFSYHSLADAQKYNPDATVEEYIDPTLMDNIELIKSRAQFRDERDGNLLYRMPCQEGEIFLKLSYDPEDGAYYDMVVYRQHKIGTLTVPITWDVATVHNFVEKHILRKPLTFELISSRRYGEPQLNKPEALRHIPQSFSVPFNRNCACPCFVSGDDLWIKHRDYFSLCWQPPADDMGKPISYYLKKYFGENHPEKFVYADTWGEIVLRNEAWIKLANLLSTLRDLHPHQIAGIVWPQICAHYAWSADTENPDWERFLEAAATATQDYLKEKK